MKKLAFALLLVALCAAAGAAAALADPPPQDENWLQTSISGDRFEIAGGKIALAKTRNGAVRALARRLIKDHTKSLHESIALAEQWGVKPPPAATPSEQWELHTLRFMARPKFDVYYPLLEIKDHNQDIEETGFEARKGAEYAFRQMAMQELPMLNMHLKLSKRTIASVEGSNTAGT